MRALSPLPLILVLLTIATPARAQYGGERGGFEREGRRRGPPSHADSLRTLRGEWQLWTHAGVDWLGTPAEVRSRYNAGLDVGASGDRRFANRAALRARLEYHDLASRQPSLVYINGYPYVSNSNYGHGWLASGVAGMAVRTWHHLWLEGGAGGGFFRSGFPSGQSYVDPVTGQRITLNGSSGWGGAWALGTRFEFQPTLRDRMLAECQFLSLDRAGTRLQFWVLRVGYRAL